MAEALINGNSYTFQNTSVLVNNIPIAHAVSFDFTVTDNSANNMGLSKEPVSRGEGSRDYTGTLELDQKEVMKISAFSPTGLLVDLHTNSSVGLFEILMIMEDRSTGSISKMLFKNCQFTSDGLSSSSGDTAMTKSYDVLFAGIDRLL